MLFKSKFEPKAIKARPQRVAEELRRIFSGIFGQDSFYDFADKVKPCLTVTNVDVSACLRYAKVFVTECNDVDRKMLIDYLSFRSKKYRFNMAQQLKLRFVPEVSFQYDAIDDRVTELDRAFAKTKAKERIEAAANSDVSALPIL
ncbi:MAG: ribosome-binding factor A [Holosporales bacterium]|nr:ribosome-binding factor A [Holosporales bacterium]